jgi:hypothetical protein
MTGALTLNANPTTALQAAPKQYVDTGDSARVLKVGDTMTGTLTTSGNLRANSSGADGGMTLRSWTGSSAFVSIATENMAGAEYALISNGTDTFVGSGVSGTTHLRGPNNNSNHQVRVDSSRVALDGLPSITSGPPHVSWPVANMPVGTKYTIGWNAAQVVFNSANTWQTIISTGTTVPAGCSVVMVQGFATFYTNTAGPFLTRVIDNVGNASVGLTLYTNFGFSHLHVPYSFAMGTSPGGRTFSLQVYGAGLNVIADANDGATITVETT